MVSKDLVPILLHELVKLVSIIGVFILAKVFIGLVELGIRLGVVEDILLTSGIASTADVLKIALNLWLIVTLVVSWLDMLSTFRFAKKAKQ
ncbi:MAG: hypothetical protein KIT70_09640 [Anaerolineales bacterium]|nr:MAG: hypothetical protein KIT70_09640 [Anaerolineales bacterium]